MSRAVIAFVFVFLVIGGWFLYHKKATVTAKSMTQVKAMPPFKAKIDRVMLRNGTNLVVRLKRSGSLNTMVVNQPNGSSNEFNYLMTLGKSNQSHIFPKAFVDYEGSVTNTVEVNKN